MSKTERDLAGEETVGALDELFDDAEFDDAMGDALESADVEMPSGRHEPLDTADEADTANGADGADDADTAELQPPAEAERVDELDENLPDDPTGETEVVPVDDAVLDDAVLDDAVLDDDEIRDDDDDPDTEAEAGDQEPDDALDADDEYVLPEIVPATPDGPEPEDEVSDESVGPVAFVEPGLEPDGDELEADEVAEEILEELRRADIDGPQVDMAPQDETTAARRRPRRAVDYDPAPVPIPARVPRVLGRKPRVRKVTRVVRHVDPWSVFKIAAIANLVLYITLLTAGVLLWNVAHATGTVDNVERFFESFGWESFEFKGGEIYHAAWIAGLFGVIGLTGFAVLLATLFNLITDLVGGVRFTVLEEEVVETRTSPLRRFVVRRPEPEVPAVIRDESGAMLREAVVDDTGANERPSR